MSDEKQEKKQSANKSRLHRLLKLLERASQLVKKVVTHPRTKAGWRWIWKRRLMVGLILLSLLLVGGITKAIMDYKQSPNKVVAAFEEAIVKENVQDLQNIVVPDTERLSFGEREARDLIAFAQEDDEFLTDSGVLGALREQASILDGSVLADQKGNQKNPTPFYVKEKNTWLGKTYRIGVHPRHLVIHVDQPGAEVLLDGKKVKMTGQTGKVGPMLPKKLRLKGIKRTEFSEAKDEQEVNLIDTTSEVKHEYLFLEGQKIRVVSDLPGTEIVINGKKTGKKAGPKRTLFGPISLDGKFKLSGEIKVPWGTIKSAAVPVKEQYSDFDITPNPFLDQKTKQQLLQTINTYAKEYVQAMEQKSVKPLTTVDDAYKEKIKEKLEHKREFKQDEQYEGEALQTVVAVHEGRVMKSKKGDGLHIQVPVQFHNRERTYDRMFSKEKPLEDHVEEAYVSLIYEEKEKKWRITSLDTIFFSDDLFESSSCVTTKFQ